MSAAHGDDCGDFPQPEEPAELSPFFGKYASSGGGSSDDYDYSSGDAYTEGGDTDTDTGDENSGAYESPPQGEPDVQAPPPTPTPAPTPAPTPSPQGGGVQTP